MQILAQLEIGRKDNFGKFAKGPPPPHPNFLYVPGVMLVAS